MKENGEIIMKKCFFVTPIGIDNSQERKISDFVMSVYLTPTLKELGYEVIRADTSFSVERIDLSIINQLKNSDLVIADVSGNNPNVMFELGYRIALEKPYIIIAQNINELPFDISSIRTLIYETIAPNILEFNAQLEIMVKNINNKSGDKNITTNLNNVLNNESDNINVTSQKDDPIYQAGQEIANEAIKSGDFSKIKDIAEIAQMLGLTSNGNPTTP
ncbi:nucleoside 2-deoxyribosyltransferase [Lactococcus lactis]|uniref:nucleoside 2-deoxyribosyltransferase n=1 Tax=Lactococcus lactis TaxID=1358 RepID=UPI00223AF4F7|nr:nucleoside 2-deoxyribosyltransferase [Lactococcus lactis]